MPATRQMLQGPSVLCVHSIARDRSAAGSTAAKLRVALKFIVNQIAEQVFQRFLQIFAYFANDRFDANFPQGFRFIP